MKALLIVRLIAGVVVAVAFFTAGQEMMRAGRFMDIHSVGGRTLEESFYQAYGVFAQALGVATMALGGLALVIAIPTNWPGSSKNPTRLAESGPVGSPSVAVPSKYPEPLSTASAVRPLRASCVRCGFSLPLDAEFCPQCGVGQSAPKRGS